MSTLQEKIDVMTAALRGEEIELLSGVEWLPCNVPNWNWENFHYRIAPKAPKKVKLLAYIGVGQLAWLEDDLTAPASWKRVPAEDKEVEVQE